MASDQDKPLTAADIGHDAWALIDAPPMLLCSQCGAPQRRCEHESSWTQSNIPAIARGKLTAIEADHERAVPVYVVEGAGLAPPIGAYRSEREAKDAIARDHAEELALLIKWASMIGNNA